MKVDIDEETANKSEATAAEDPFFQTSAARGDTSCNAVAGAEKPKDGHLLGTTASKEEMGTAGPEAVKFSQNSFTSKVEKQQSGLDEGEAGNDSSANQKTAPVASLASFATAESGQEFGRPDLVNDSQVQ